MLFGVFFIFSYFPSLINFWDEVCLYVQYLAQWDIGLANINNCASSLLSVIVAVHRNCIMTT